MAIKTKNTVLTINDIDVEWCFQFYLHLDKALTGSNVKIKSPFSIDNIPSFSLYKKANDPYLFHCLSSGTKGDIIELVRLLKKAELGKDINRTEAFEIIRRDFSAHLSGNNNYVRSEVKTLLNTPGVVTSHEMRKWQMNDAKFWGKFEVSKKDLELYNIAPLAKFTMHKIKDGVEHNMVIQNPLSYGYYNNKGELAKIYQPGIKGAKFLKVIEYIQGEDQLKYNADNLLIISSMKDGLCFKGFGIKNYEWVAPDSENVMIPRDKMNFYKTKYKNIRVLFDIDGPGVAAAEKYKQIYDLPYIYLDLEKDLSDSVFIHGGIFTKIKLLQLL